MSDENEVVQQDAAENALDPAQAKAEEAVTETETPDPAQEKAEAEARAAKREARRERKDYYELKAKAEYLERELRRREQTVNQEPQSDDVDDIDARVERKIAEIRAKEAETEFATKRDKVFAKAAEIGDFDGEDFLKSYKVGGVTADAILNSEHGARIAQYLYENPDEADRIATLSPYGQGKEMTKLEDKFSAASVKKSAAPAPIKPVGSKGSGEIVYRPDMSDAEYNKWLDQQHKSKRG